MTAATTTVESALHQEAQAFSQQFTEEQLVQADQDYLEQQRQRDERRLAEVADLERAYVARRGWAL